MHDVRHGAVEVERIKNGTEEKEVNKKQYEHCIKGRKHVKE